MYLFQLFAFSDFSRKWRSGDAANPGVYELHLNLETKNKVTRANVVKIQTEFSEFFRPILIRISGSPNITSDDRIALNIAEPFTSHSHPATPIEQRCFPSVIMMGGGMVKFKCYQTINSGRAGLPELANGLVLAYRIDLPIVAPDSSPEKTKSKVIRPEFAGPDDNTTKITQTKAIFTLELGSDNACCILQFYCRWINSVHPELNGPWTGPYSEAIL